MVSSLIARRWFRTQTQWRLWRKALIGGLVPDVWLKLGPPWLNLRVSFSSDYLWVVSHFLCFIKVSLFDYIVSLWWCIEIVRNPSCELNIFVLQQAQNLGRRFGTSKMHLSPTLKTHHHSFALFLKTVYVIEKLLAVFNVQPRIDMNQSLICCTITRRCWWRHMGTYSIQHLSAQLSEAFLIIFMFKLWRV